MLMLQMIITVWPNNFNQDNHPDFLPRSTSTSIRQSALELIIKDILTTLQFHFCIYFDLSHGNQIGLQAHYTPLKIIGLTNNLL